MSTSPPGLRRVEIKNDTAPGFVVAGPQDIYDILHGELVARLAKDIDPEDLIGLDPFFDENTAKSTRERVRHELRTFTSAISERGAVGGKLHVGILHSAVAYQFNEFERMLALEQPNCEWRLVAFKIERKGNEVTVERRYDGVTFGTDQPMAAAMTGEGRGDGQRGPRALERTIDYASEMDYRAHFSAVYADVGFGDLVDPNVQWEPTWEGPMTRYVVTRALRHMSRGQRLNRRKNEDLIRAFYGVGAAAEGGTVTIPVRLDADIAAKVVAMRAGGDGVAPKGPAAIAKELGVPIDRVKEILRVEGNANVGD